MKTTFISTAAIGHATRQSISELQVELVKAQEELVTGKKSDVGLELGHRAGRAVALRHQFDRFQSIVDTNQLANVRLETTQATMGQLVEQAESFLSTLLSARNANTGPAVAAQSGKANLQELIESLNTTASGGHLFAGINTDIVPMTDYYAEPSSPARQAIAADFIAAFGVTPENSADAAIDAAAMSSFLDGPFNAQFDVAAWKSNWSSASDQNVKSRISISTMIETSVGANEEAFRTLAKAYTMMADLGVEGLSEPAYEAVVDQAITQVGTAINGLAGIQASLGVAQERISLESEKFDLQMQLLEREIEFHEGVDSFEASTHVSTLLAQIETSYAVTSRLYQLSLSNYL